MAETDEEKLLREAEAAYNQRQWERFPMAPIAPMPRAPKAPPTEGAMKRYKEFIVHAQCGSLGWGNAECKSLKDLNELLSKCAQLDGHKRRRDALVMSLYSKRTKPSTMRPRRP